MHAVSVNIKTTGNIKILQRKVLFVEFSQFSEYTVYRIVACFADDENISR